MAAFRGRNRVRVGARVVPEDGVVAVEVEEATGGGGGEPGITVFCELAAVSVSRSGARPNGGSVCRLLAVCVWVCSRRLEPMEELE
jgi:hypothetical protein